MKENTETAKEQSAGAAFIRGSYQFVLRTKESRGLWRWFSYVLTLAAAVYIVVLFSYGGQQLGNINWSAYIPITLLSLPIYLASLLMQLFVWLRLVSFHRQIDWRDLEIYSRMLLLRSLPGGVWHWVGRAAMYKAATQVSGRAVVKANSIEWILFLLSGLGVFAQTKFPEPSWIVVAIMIVGVSVGVASRGQPARNRVGLRLSESALWILLDMLSWWLGGWILFLFVQASGVHDAGLIEMARVTTLVGAVSLVAGLLPMSFGIREVSLVFLLQPYMPNALGVLVALLIRLLYVFADAFWGLVGWGMSRLVQRLHGDAARTAIPS